MQSTAKVEMVGRDGTVWVLPEDVPAWEREGYWIRSKLPKAQTAPGPATPMDTGRGQQDDAEF